ncbi:hypothetical protein VTO42DRAFT_844 [Malbranchea cinnamomea]
MEGLDIPPTILIIGTCDTKCEELVYLRDRILERKNCKTILIDVGRNACLHDAIDVSNETLLRRNEPSLLPSDPLPPLPLARAEYIRIMAKGASSYVAEMFRRRRIHGIVSVGGSSATSLASIVMREALPVGFPKLIVSTMASGDVKPFIEDTDITMMYSVVDITGVNSILGRILSNAAGAIDGMTVSYHNSIFNPPKGPRQKRVAVTMFSTTTRCVDAIRLHLESQYQCEVYVFHATGAGGRTMERLIRERKIDGVIDVTTSEIADEVVGGVLSAGPNRLAAASQMGIPQVVSTGACDVVNFGPRDTIPDKFKDREVREHNPAVSLIRTTPAECAKIGEFISRNIRENICHPDLVQVMLPEGGLSSLSTPGEIFHNPQADSVLFSTIEKGLQGTGIKVSKYPGPINSIEFAVQMANALGAMMKRLNPT